jgi:FAD/FMN-containing dehydrogenase
MVTRAQIEKALGDRWKQFAEARRTFDPNNRLLNAYFRDVLGEA